MPSLTDDATIVPSKTPLGAKVELIAWDPESPAHAERMVQQRVACGWKQDWIEKWRVLQREGKMALQWIVLSDQNPSKSSHLSQHLAKYPGESTPLLDTAVALAGQPRDPTSQAFIPIGHISLDAESSVPDQADASRGIYCITSLYISRAIQGGGLGRAAMDVVEREAVGEPLNAKVLSLDTIAKSAAENVELWKALGMDMPTLSNEEWYERRGYQVWKEVEGHIQHRDPQGKVWPIDVKLMKKTIA